MSTYDIQWSWATPGPPTPVTVSGITIISGAVQANQGTPDGSPWPVTVSTPVGVSGTVTVLQGTSPWAVSGELSVVISQPLGVSGTVSSHILDLPSPIEVSGTISTHILDLPQPLGVSGTVSSHILDLPNPVGVSGTISIGNSPSVSILGSIGVSGTVNSSLPLPVGISGTVSTHILDIPQPLEVSGTVAVHVLDTPQPLAISGTVFANVIALPLPIGVSGTVSSHILDLPNPVGVSGTITANQGLPNTVPWTVSGNTYTPDTAASGSISASGSWVQISINDQAAVAIQIAGDWSGTLQFEATTNGSGYVAIYGLQAGVDNIYTSITEYLNNHIFRCTTAGFQTVRVRSTAWTSGTANIFMIASRATSTVGINFPIPLSPSLKTIPLSGININSETVVWTPTTGRRFRMLGMQLDTGLINGYIRLRDGLAGTLFWIAPTTSTGTIPGLELTNGYLSTAPGNSLTLHASANATIFGTIWGYEE